MSWWEPETCTYVSEFVFVDDEGVLNTAAEQERIRVYSLPEWRALCDGAGLVLVAHKSASEPAPDLPGEAHGRSAPTASHVPSS